MRRSRPAQPEIYDPLLVEHPQRPADCHDATGGRHAAVTRPCGRPSAAPPRAGAPRTTDRDPSVHEPELARVLANLNPRRQNNGGFGGAVTVARESVSLTRRLAESDWPTCHALTARRLRVLGRALRRSGDHAMAVACHEESESVPEDVAGGAEAAPRAFALASTLAAARSGLARSLDGAARAHLTNDRSAEAVAGLSSSSPSPVAPTRPTSTPPASPPSPMPARGTARRSYGPGGRRRAGVSRRSSAACPRRTQRSRRSGSGRTPRADPCPAYRFHTLFRSTPPGLKQAARLDGTGPWRTFFAITVPMSKPAIASAAILGMPTSPPRLPVHGLVHPPRATETLGWSVTASMPAIERRIDRPAFGPPVTSEAHHHRSDSMLELTTSALIARPSPENRAIRYKG